MSCECKFLMFGFYFCRFRDDEGLIIDIECSCYRGNCHKQVSGFEKLASVVNSKSSLSYGTFNGLDHQIITRLP